MLYPRIKKVAKKAERMMVFAVEGNGKGFDLAADEVLRDLANFYPSSRSDRP